jgi:hypothetical protein
MKTPSYHCHQRMHSETVTLLSGNKLTSFTCKACGHRERTVTSRRGALLSWRNVSRVQAVPA